MSWRMPAETAPQDRVWMAFPVGGYTLGDDAASAHEARSTWAAVAHAVAEFEPVRMVVDPRERAAATRYLSVDIEVLEAPLDDSWMRDIGPTFVHGPGGELGAVDWTFNGWGAQDWASWKEDAEIGRFVTGASGATAVSSLLVNEGGGFHVDGEGTVLLTETVQLDPGRNPYADRARVEADLARTIGTEHAVWLPRGLTRDQERYGTRGHVDMVAAIPSPGTVLLHAQNDPAHPDFAVSREVRRVLQDAHDAAGRSFTVIDLPAPTRLRDSEGVVDYNYVNHLVVNGGVVACSFGEEKADAVARDILAEAYPGRRVVSVDARPLFARGGGIHCITQQQPSRPASGS
ncbi:agmatine deiminase [Cryobacterium roopkundense]|uniref:Agmatine deiminase n=1 Tax=Cryobacterium roopkundense TaxID=1001240 RepID=A0A099J358_9MICO|nr:agmatine deiminase family protein [Cryobacterium roopkundense]KGJ72480.1 agmatine deiminase [Cryobacterium roopkundense]MBB5642236.1 agmatine deiminase [Cryobacterium roopkundense]